MTASHPARIASVLLAFALLAAGWWLLAPSQLGGRTSYAIVIGNSMEPSLERGDLVVTRARPAYAKGDVVLYLDRPTGKRYLHRIVRVDGDRLVTKGDNNHYVDPTRPAVSDVRGELLLTLPGVGRALEWLVRPVNLAVLFFVATFLALAGGREVARRRTPYSVRPVRAEPAPRGAGLHLAGAARPLLGGALAATALFGLLAAAAWRAPASLERTVSGAYAHEGRIAYTGRARPGPVYPDGLVRTGETAFTRLVPGLDVRFDYAFTARTRSDVRGSIALDAVVSDGQGWSRTVPLAPPTAFAGEAAKVRGTLDLRRLTRLVGQVRDLTGATTSIYRVELAPSVEVTGYAGTTVVDEEFAPRLPLVFDGTSLRFDASAGELAELTAPSVRGTATRSEPGTIGVGPAGLPVERARTLGLLGLLVSLTVLGAAAWIVARGLTGPPRERIAVRFGGRIVSARAVIPQGRWVTEVGSIDELVRIADHYDRVVLHASEPDGDVYVVDDGVTVYRYAPASAEAPTLVLPAPVR
jgi:signal peptidase